MNNNCIRIVSLYRYAIKGLSGDAFESVQLEHEGDTFPDDRKYALLKYPDKFDPMKPQWLHKENFLCAFTNPQLMAKYKSKYEILPSSSSTKNKNILTIWKKDSNFGFKSNQLPDCQVDLETQLGREKLAQYFSEESQQSLTCVCSSTGEKKHQFGNTSSGVKARNDTRTIHIINAATVRQVSSVLGIPLRPERFRPNIIIDGCEPWSEFDWVDSTIFINNNNENVQMDVIRTTVRCAGVSIDPDTYTGNKEDEVDIPTLLQKHFPQYGPYLGVYAILKSPGTISIGDSIHTTPPK